MHKVFLVIQKEREKSQVESRDWLESAQEGPGNVHIRKDSMKVMKWVIWLEEKVHKLQHIKIMRVNELS